MPAGSLLATDDGGASWRTATRGPLAAACFFDPRRGLALAAQPGRRRDAVLSTSSAGAAWSIAGRLPAGFPQQLVCTPDGGAWLVMAGEGEMTRQACTVYRSADFGLSFKPVPARAAAPGLPAPGDPHDIAQAPGTSPSPIAAAGRDHTMVLGLCYACGHGGDIVLARTADGGRSWQSGPLAGAVPSPPMFLDMLSPSRAWLLTGQETVGVPGPGTLSAMQATADDGATWSTVPLASPLGPVGRVQFATPKVGYGVAAAGRPRLVLRSDDAGRRWRIAGSLPVFVAGGYTALAALSANTILVGAGRSLLLSSDGGKSFRRLSAPSAPYGFGLGSLAFASAGLGCAAVVYQGGVKDYLTRDGGRSWHATRQQGQAAAPCADEISRPQRAAIAEELIARLSPRARGKGYVPPRFVAANLALGAGSLWINFSGSNTAAGRLYVSSQGKPSVQVHALPASLGDIGGLSVLGSDRAYL